MANNDQATPTAPCPSPLTPLLAPPSLPVSPIKLDVDEAMIEPDENKENIEPSSLATAKQSGKRLFADMSKQLHFLHQYLRSSEIFRIYIPIVCEACCFFMLYPVCVP